MKRIFFALALAGLSAVVASATQLNEGSKPKSSTLSTTTTEEQDSLRHYDLQAIEVTALRATKSSPVAHSNITEEQIARHNYGLDIPSLLALTPSMIATNETGIGIGGTSIRLRGTDATRINVTINGVALNNPDSHSTYFYDTPDLISAIGDVQVQRGAGLSTNGTGAFGGAVSMTSASPSIEAGGDVSFSYGSYNTNKQAIHLSSGRLGKGWVVDARLTHIGSDGYVDRGATDLKSYLLQGAYYSSRTSLKLLSFGGKAKTNLTYTGATMQEMELYGRRYHSEGQYETSHGPHILADGTHVDYYDDQTDNYLQINNQLILSHTLSDRWQMGLTGFYTYGYGYYKQYKASRTLFEYMNLGINDYSAEADLIRRKIMLNHNYGLNASLGYTTSRLWLVVGGEWSRYTSPHWGELDWVDGMEQSQIGGRWYDNNVAKQDANIFLKSSWLAAEGLRFMADLQYRMVDYHAWGVNDNFDWEREQMQPIAVDQRYHFFNPRVGLSYDFKERNNLYFSLSIAQKEPTRSDFTDRYMFSSDESQPSPERLYDYELGYRYHAPRFSANINLYYMRYRDQLIPTGMVNDSSDALNVNVPDSYRCGVELMAEWQIASWLSFGSNATLSRNKLKNYVDMLAESPTYGQNLGTMSIAYSPEVMASAYLNLHHKGFEAGLRSQYVGEQYLTNNEIQSLMLDAYTVTNLDLAYTLNHSSKRKTRFALTLYNLFNAQYCSNGYGYSYMWDGKRYDEAYYFPQAPIHLLANVTVKF